MNFRESEGEDSGAKSRLGPFGDIHKIRAWNNNKNNNNNNNNGGGGGGCGGGDGVENIGKIMRFK